MQTATFTILFYLIITYTTLTRRFGIIQTHQKIIRRAISDKQKVNYHPCHLVLLEQYLYIVTKKIGNILNILTDHKLGQWMMQ